VTAAWKRVPLQALAESVDYGVTASANLVEVGPKFLRITDIQDGRVDWDQVPYCVCNAEEAAAAALRTGDIVFARTGATTGKSFLITECPKDAVFASYLIRVRLHRDVEPRYIRHFFDTPDYWAQVTKGARGAAQPGVNATTLKALQVSIPSLAEQRRIAAILDKADQLRAKRKEALALLDSMAQSIFVDMFGDPASNPKDWLMCDLDELVAQSDSINYGVVQPGDEHEGGVPLIRVGDLVGGRVNHSALKRISPTIEKAYVRSRLQGDEILVSCVGSIGVVAMASEREAGFNIARAVSRIRLSNRVTRRFMAEQLRTPGVQRYFNQELRTVSQPTLNIKQICETRVMVPPLKEQEVFEEKLIRLARCQELLRIASENADTLFASLKHRAFIGDL
jgi:type I restriction enzyme, S subunit